MGWGYRRISGGVGDSSLAILDLRSVMALILNSDMMCGVRIQPCSLIVHFGSI
jgi:hypothetical protein